MYQSLALPINECGDNLKNIGSSNCSRRKVHAKRCINRSYWKKKKSNRAIHLVLDDKLKKIWAMEK